MKKARPIAKNAKSKNQKKLLKDVSTASITQRYLELRMLRLQLSEAEACRRVR